MGGIRILESVSDEEWDRLSDLSKTATFFQTRKWLKIWAKHFLENPLLTFSFYVDDKLIGLVPLHKQGEEYFIAGVTPVLGDEYVSDYGDILTIPGKEEVVWKKLLEYLEGKLTINFLREDSESFKVLQSLTTYYQEEESAPFINLPSSFEGYLNSLVRKKRHEIKRKLRRLEREGKFSFEVSHNIEDAEVLISLMKKSHEGKKKFLSREMENFFNKILSEYLSDEIMHLFILSFEGKNIALSAVIEYKNEYLLYNSGFDTDYANISPSLNLKVLIIKHAIGKGIKKFDFLRGRERYKLDLGGNSLKLYKFWLIS